MKFTIQDCMNLASFDRAQVVAGKDGLGSIVKTVTVLENSKPANIKQYMGGEDQLILTSFFDIPKDAEAQKAAVKALSQVGNVGLVLFHMGNVVKELPQEVLDLADDLEFPVITIGDKVRMGDCIHEITERIVWGDGDDRGEQLINNTIFHLLNFEKYNSFQAALKAAAVANDYQLILLSENFNPIFSVETRYRATIADAIKLGKERSMKKQQDVFTLVNVNGVITYWGPIQIQGEKYFMFIVDNEDNYTAADITKLAEVIELAMGMWKYSPERDVRAEFLKALRRGNASLAYSFQDEVDIDPDRVLSIFFAQQADKNERNQLLDALESEPSLELISLTEEEDSYGLILADPDDKDASAKCLKIYDSCKGSKEITVFHITGLLGLEGAADAFSLIGETNPFAKSVFPLKSVFTKYEMAMISNCINIQLQGGAVKKHYLEFFEPFDKLGTNKREQLIETLEAFVLDAGMNNARTSRILDIHTNTVQYRLRKIDDLMGAEITGNRVIPGLTIALALLRLERVVSQ